MEADIVEGGETEGMLSDNSAGAAGEDHTDTESGYVEAHYLQDPPLVFLGGAHSFQIHATLGTLAHMEYQFS